MDRRNEKQQRRRNRQARRDRVHHPEPPEDALSGLAVGFDEDHPLTFLTHISGLWAALTAPDPDGDRPDPIEFIQSMIEIAVPQTTAILTALGHFVDDELLSLRIRRELETRTHRVPTWLASLDAVTVARVARQTEPFGDGDQYWVELAWPDGSAMSLGVLVDANWGQAFKDLMVLPTTISALEDIIEKHAEPGDDITFVPIEPADVRARITEAIAHTDMFFPPLENESWPQGRPLLTWALDKLPEGGQGFPEVDLEEPARQAIVDAFLTSPHAARLGKHGATTVDSLVWFAGYNCGDPLRWSPVKLDHLLLDWWHRKIIQSQTADRAMPTILRAFVQWSGERSGLAPHRIEENLAAIDRLEPGFLADIGTPRRNTAAGLAQLVAGLPPAAPDHSGLDTAPLPDEDFAEEGIPSDILPAVRAALAAVESDLEARALPQASELRTAARRLVHHTAVADPTAWRRRVNPASTACTMAYLVYDINHLLRTQVRVKDLVAAFGLKAAPQSRIDTFGRALTDPFGPGEAAFMTSEARSRILSLLESWPDR